MGDFRKTKSGLFVPSGLPDLAKAFCDESGNTGPDYIEPTQPFFVLAAWIVPNECVVDASIDVETFKQQHIPQAQELKASSVLMRPSREQNAALLFQALLRRGCIPIYVLAEKKYCIAAKIVETFLDPSFNTLITNRFAADFETKQQIANSLYEELPDSILHDFAKAYRSPEAYNLSRVLSEIIKTVKTDISKPLADTLLGSTLSIDQIAESEARTHFPNKLDLTLNMPCMVLFFMMLEGAAKASRQYLEILHDETCAYQLGYQKVFELHVGEQEDMITFAHTNVKYSQLRSLVKFDTVNSASTPLIQAADLLAGVVRHCALLSITGTCFKTS